MWVNPDGVRVQFGTRAAGDEANFGEAGAPSGTSKTLAININASDFTAGSSTYNGPTAVLPAGVVIKSITAEVVTAFASMGGTTPVLNVGKSGSVSTDRICDFSNAQVAAVAPLDLTSRQLGVFAAATPLTAATTITIGLSGTSPTVTSAVGRIVALVRYEDPAGVAG
jgi:hypothetical protein